MKVKKKRIEWKWRKDRLRNISKYKENKINEEKILCGRNYVNNMSYKE